MSRRLCTVEHVVAVHTRVVPFPGIVPGDDEVFRVGDRLVLRRPDGTSCETRIAEFTLVHGHAPDELHVVLALTKEDIPVGTEVWTGD